MINNAAVAILLFTIVAHELHTAVCPHSGTHSLSSHLQSGLSCFQLRFASHRTFLLFTIFWIDTNKINTELSLLTLNINQSCQQHMFWWDLSHFNIFVTWQFVDSVILLWCQCFFFLIFGTIFNCFRCHWCFLNYENGAEHPSVLVVY